MQCKPLFVAVMGCAVMLGGCASLEEMNAQAAAQQRAADQAQCAGYGYQPGTDKFADCMLATSHHRDVQNAIAQQQAAQKQRQQDRQWEMDKARNAADTAQRRADMERTMNSGSGSMIPAMPTVPAMPAGTNCTSTTTSQQTDNAGTSTTTTSCH